MTLVLFSFFFLMNFFINLGFSKNESSREDTDLDDVKKILRGYFFQEESKMISSVVYSIVILFMK